MTDAYIYSLKTVLELGPADQLSDTLTTRTLGALNVLAPMLSCCHQTTTIPEFRLVWMHIVD